LSSSHDPATHLAAQRLRLPMAPQSERQRRRGVHDLVTLTLCPRYAHYFSQGHYPSNTPAAVLGQILHRTIKNLHGHYLAKLREGMTLWIPGEAETLEECKLVEESKRAQGMPPLRNHQSERLRRVLCNFHMLEARTFYPRIQAAEVPLAWLWEEAPGGPVLLEGTVDVVLVESATHPDAIALWDYKAGKNPGLGNPQLRAYERQLRLYAFLYQRCYGVLPNQLALYFMGELDRKTPHATRPPKALYELSPSPSDEAGTLEWLRMTLEQDETCKQSGKWEAPEADQAPQGLCRNCQVRFSCPSVRTPYLWDSGAEQADELDPYEF
jgi:ATP-dependent exoDNAse (exonuclease V) beta subunit